jgi:hypothetical protein
MAGACLVDIEAVIIPKSVFEWEIRTSEFRKVSKVCDDGLLV